MSIQLLRSVNPIIPYNHTQLYTCITRHFFVAPNRVDTDIKTNKHIVSVESNIDTASYSNINQLRQKLIQIRHPKHKNNISATYNNHTQTPGSSTSGHTANSTDNDSNLTNIPGQRIRTIHSSGDAIDTVPSDYIRQLLLLIHPDVITTNNEYSKVPVRLSTTDGVNQYAESIDTIQQYNQTNLAMLNAILDYNKQFDTQQYISNNNNKLIRPPIRQTLSFYCISNTNQSIRHISVQYKPPHRLSSSTAVPSILIQDSIEQLVYNLLKLTHIDMSESLTAHWKQQWYKHKLQYGYIKSKSNKHNHSNDNMLHGIDLSHSGVTGDKLREKEFLAAFRDHRSSIIPPNNSHIDITREYNIEQWAAQRPRYTLCSMMIEAELIEFDKRLDSVQSTHALQTLQHAIKNHYTELHTSLWMGIGICFVPPTHINKNNDNRNLQLDIETPLINSILRHTTGEYNTEWDFISRPGWWLIPYDFKSNQFIQFVQLFLHANKTDMQQSIDSTHQHQHIQP